MGGRGSSGGANKLNYDQRIDRISEYQEGYIEINEDLRNGKEFKDLTLQEREIYLSFKEEMESLKGDKVVYRGLGDYGAEMADNIGEGGIFTDPAFVSTSEDQEMAYTQGGSGEKEWMATVNLTPGTRYYDMEWSGLQNLFPGQREIVVDHGTSFKIDSIDRENRWMTLTRVK